MKQPAVSIVGLDGQPLRPNKANMLAGGGNAPYDAADNFGSHVAAWRPYLYSPDGELNMFRDRIVARTRDLVRNDGWASGIVTRITDNAIGGHFRPTFKPDYRALAQYTGNKAFDSSWADEFGRAVEAHYRTWANDPGRYCDAQRSLTVTQMLRLALRHKLVDGDALAQVAWMPERVGAGRARYATAIQMIDPDRLSNPQQRFDSETSRGGVVVDAFGAATGYWIRRAHQGDWWAAADSVRWDLIPRETSWGRPIIIHDFDHDRAGQHRGGAGIFAPILQRMKMLWKYDETELDAAVINAIFGAYVESPFDHQLMEQALGDDVDLNQYQNQRAEFHEKRRTMLGEARVPILFPGEKINTVAAERPSGNFKEFEGSFLRNFSAQTGLSAQQVSNNWSDVNYSSARGALLEAWKTMQRRQHDFAQNFAQPITTSWLEESFDVDDYPLPAKAPPFLQCRAAYARAEWMGPGRGWIDPVDEKKGAILGMDGALSTLQRECAEQGLDYEEVLEQRKREIELFKKLGLDVPSWAAIDPGGSAVKQPKNANDTIKDPEPT
jgi:lambda family phage portal protein